MARNLTFTITQGEVGKVLRFKFEPTNIDGEPEAVNISTWTTTLTALRGTTAVINAVACTPDPDQVANIGEGSYTFDVTTANIAPGEYKLRIKGVDAGSNVYYFPTLPNRTYAVLKVLPQ